jgi:putative hydrolase of the HAD superfamily
MGFKLFTASNEDSRELNGYLRGMGVRQYFDTLYGSDLVNRGKYSAEYYRRVFADSGVDPKHALVVDDNPNCLAWARSLGAATCLVNATPPQNVQTDFVVSSLAELPSAIDKAQAEL